MSVDHPPHGPQDPSALGAVPRPGTVTAGAILGWIGSALLVASGAATIIAASTMGSESVVGAFSWAITLTGGIVIAAGLLGLLLTTLAFRGSRGSLIALTVLAVVCALVPIGATLYLLTSVETRITFPWRAYGATIWAAAVIALFWSGRSWFRVLRRTRT